MRQLQPHGPSSSPSLAISASKNIEVNIRDRYNHERIYMYTSDSTKRAMCLHWRIPTPLTVSVLAATQLVVEAGLVTKITARLATIKAPATKEISKMLPLLAGNFPMMT